jgi:alpha-beta hydrolase superfamily lysophospholipase
MYRHGGKVTNSFDQALTAADGQRTFGPMIWLLVGVAVGGLLILAYALPRRIVRPLRRGINLDPGDLGFPHEAGTLQSEDGPQLSYYYVPATVPARGNLILLHGKDSAKEAYLEYLPELCPYGYNLLLFDARAHGGSGGTYTTFGYHEWRDVRTAADRLRHLAPGLPTGVFGHSMGGAVAVQALARGVALDFAIVESAFSHLGSIVHAYAERMSGVPLPYPLTNWLLDRAETLADFQHDRVDPLALAPEIRVPVLVVHGELDRAIDVDHGRNLYVALGSRRKELYVVTGGGHDDLTEVGGETYYRRLRTFLAEVTD